MVFPKYDNTIFIPDVITAFKHRLLLFLLFIFSIYYSTLHLNMYVPYNSPERKIFPLFNRVCIYLYMCICNGIVDMVFPLPFWYFPLLAVQYGVYMVHYLYRIMMMIRIL